MKQRTTILFSCGQCREFSQSIMKYNIYQVLASMSNAHMRHLLCLVIFTLCFDWLSGVQVTAWLQCFSIVVTPTLKFSGTYSRNASSTFSLCDHNIHLSETKKMKLKYFENTCQQRATPAKRLIFCTLPFIACCGSPIFSSQQICAYQLWLYI